MKNDNKRGHAYRIETQRLVLRCWNPEDAHLLKEAIDASVEHLKPWMPWVHAEPEELEVIIVRLRKFRGNFDLDKEYVYGIFDREEKKVLGGTGFHPRVGDDALEIGYWIHADHINHGLATEVSAALTKVAFQINKVKRVEIQCDPENIRSARVPEKLGYVKEGLLRQRVPTHEGELRDSEIWTMLADEFAASTSNEIEIEAFDVVGDKLL